MRSAERSTYLVDDSWRECLEHMNENEENKTRLGNCLIILCVEKYQYRASQHSSKKSRETCGSAKIVKLDL